MRPVLPSEAELRSVTKPGQWTLHLSRLSVNVHRVAAATHGVLLSVHVVYYVGWHIA